MKRIIIVLFLVLVLLIILTRSNMVSANEIYNGDYWDNYRLGDVFYRKLDEPHYNDPDYYDYIGYHKTEYPGSIANEYINKNNSTDPENKNYKLMSEIIESRIVDKNTYPDTLFLHIRVGDVFCDKTEWLNKINGPEIYSKVGDKKWWRKIVYDIKENNIKKVVIISGSHKNMCLDESLKYLEDRKQFLISKIPGLTVEYRLGDSPDQNILLVYHVKHFKTTGGEYGRLLTDINKIGKNNLK